MGFLNIKNTIDFFLRSQLRIPFPINEKETTHPLAVKLQDEMEVFLKAFDWKKHLSGRSIKKLRIADVGTRTFSIAPVLDRVFRELGFEPEIHGIEIDAFRRFSNLHSRADYGNYYARKIPNGYFRPIDFLDFKSEMDVILLLHPFVTMEPLLNWGLPAKEFKPEIIFGHARKLLEGESSLLLISSPTAEEFNISERLARKTGFNLVETQDWFPKDYTSQKQFRLGQLLLSSQSPYLQKLE